MAPALNSLLVILLSLSMSGILSAGEPIETAEAPPVLADPMAGFQHPDDKKKEAEMNKKDPKYKHHRGYPVPWTFRTGKHRLLALERGGGSEQSEAAIQRALVWLAAHQSKDGRWSYTGTDNKHHNDIALTSLAVLAFLGSGHKPLIQQTDSKSENPVAKIDGKVDHQETIRRGVKWLMKKRKRMKLTSSRTPMGCGTYQAALGTMALAEAYGMSGAEPIRIEAQKAVNYAFNIQNRLGGWGYRARGNRNDTSVTGWWVMALKSAQMANLKVDRKKLALAGWFLKSVTHKKGTVSYQFIGRSLHKRSGGGGGSRRMTAVSLACIQFLGAKKDDRRVVACAKRTLKERWRPGQSDFYLRYYQTLGLFHSHRGTPEWATFNESLQDTLIQTQVMIGSVNENKGSWSPNTDQYGGQWKRVGQTALAVLMLEIYYRYPHKEDPAPPPPPRFEEDEDDPYGGR